LSYQLVFRNFELSLPSNLNNHFINMATTADIRNGLCIDFNNDLCYVVEFQHVKPGKGGAFVRTKLKSIKTGKLLQNTFPAGQFEWRHSDQPIDQIDYSQFPLRAGDLVYIYSGLQGDYSHVLAVTRVDADGRVYSVTNNFTEAGFVVLEYLLYDPAIPGTGIFYAWPDFANRELGLTGLGGMDIWHPLSLPLYADGPP
jgi:hypothetical protein